MNEILNELVTLLRASLPTTISVMYGDAQGEARSMLPLVCVSPVSTKFSIAGTGGLRREEFEVDIITYISLKEFSTRSGLSVKYQEELVNIMEERETTRVPKSTTVLGIINNNLELGGGSDTIISDTIQYKTFEDVRVAQATMKVTYIRILPNI